MNGLGAVAVGVAIGLAFCLPILWRLRVAIKESWQEVLGVIPRDSSAEVARLRTLSEHRSTWSLPRLTVVVLGAALVACFLIAIATEDPVIRLLNVAICVISAAALGTMFARSRSGA